MKPIDNSLQRPAGAWTGRPGWGVWVAPAAALGGNLVLRLALLPMVPWGWGAVAALLWGVALDLGAALLIAQPGFPAPGRPIRWVGTVLRAAAWSGWVFWLAVQYVLFMEFRTRPDHIVVDYIAYTAEVTGNVWESYPVLPVLAGCLVAGFLLTRLPGGSVGLGLGWRVGWNLAGLALFAGSVLWSPPLVEATHRELAQNGGATLARAVLTGQLEYHAHYAALPPGRAEEVVRAAMAREPGFRAFQFDQGVRRRVEPPGPVRSPNVVLILAESLGSELTGLGTGPSLTPRLDRLLDEALVFRRFYATGTRTARALEAVWASFPPIPGLSVLQRRPLVEMDTLASVLRARGYRTVFLYGGRPSFDRMGPFAARNGFEEVIGQAELDPGPDGFATSWGYADEHVFDRALRELRRHRPGDRRLFLSLLTVTNHRPFQFPVGGVGREGLGTRVGATRYADWALGRFIDQVAAEGLAGDTLFVLVGDHGPRSYLRDRLPVDAHRVPFVLWGPEWLPRGQRDTPVGSTMDVAPTLLGLLGDSYQAAFFGRDLLRVDDGGWAPLQNKRDIGVLAADRLVVVGFNKRLTVARADAADRLATEQPATLAEPGVAAAVALYQVAYDLYVGGGLKPAGGE